VNTMHTGSIKLSTTFGDFKEGGTFLHRHS
jgi:hypothetical protein